MVWEGNGLTWEKEKLAEMGSRTEIFNFLGPTGQYEIYWDKCKCVCPLILSACNSWFLGDIFSMG